MLLTVLDPLLLLLLLQVSPPSSSLPSTSRGSSKLPPWPQCKGMGRGTWTRSKGRSSRKSKSASMSWIILSGGRGVFIWGSTYNHPSSSMCPTTMLFHTSWVTLEQARILRASTSIHTPAIRKLRPWDLTTFILTCPHRVVKDERWKIERAGWIQNRKTSLQRRRSHWIWSRKC